MSGNTEPRRWMVWRSNEGGGVGVEVLVVEASAYDALAAELATLSADHEALTAECEWYTVQMREGDQDRRVLVAKIAAWKLAAETWEEKHDTLAAENAALREALDGVAQRCAEMRGKLDPSVWPGAISVVSAIEAHLGLCLHRAKLARDAQDAGAYDKETGDA